MDTFMYDYDVILESDLEDEDFDFDTLEEGEQADAYRARKAAEKDKAHADDIHASDRYMRMVQHQGTSQSATDNMKRAMRSSDRGRELNSINNKAEKEYKKTGSLDKSISAVQNDKRMASKSADMARAADAYTRHQRRHPSKEALEDMMDDIQFTDIMMEDLMQDEF